MSAKTILPSLSSGIITKAASVPFLIICAQYSASSEKVKDEALDVVTGCQNEKKGQNKIVLQTGGDCTVMPEARCPAVTSECRIAWRSDTIFDAFSQQQ